MKKLLPIRGRRAGGDRLHGGMARHRRRWLVAALLVGHASACRPASELDRAAGRMTAIQSASPFTIPDFELTDRGGSAVNVRDVTRDRFALLFFGYTNCPDVCPISMAVANAAVGQLDPAERERVRIVFVTVDPKRDTPERIDEWLTALRTSAVGLRGSSTRLTEFMEAMGFRVPPTTSWEPLPGSTDGYLVPHPTALFLVTPDGLGRFQYGYDRATPAEIAADLRLLMAIDWAAQQAG